MGELPADRLTDAELAAWKGMLATHARVVARLDAELRDQHDLPLLEYEVLMNLTDQPDKKARMGDLADLVLLSRSGLTRVVDRLERRGLVRRTPSPEDGRSSYAELTSEGKRQVTAARRTHLAGVRRLFTSRLGSDQMAELARAWSSVDRD